MNKYLLAALQIIVKSLITSLNYERLKFLILNVESSDLSGEDKKQLVLKEAASIIEEVGRDFVSLAIKAIVVYLRNR